MTLYNNYPFYLVSRIQNTLNTLFDKSLAAWNNSEVSTYNQRKKKRKLLLTQSSIIIIIIITLFNLIAVPNQNKVVLNQRRIIINKISVNSLMNLRPCQSLYYYSYIITASNTEGQSCQLRWHTYRSQHSPLSPISTYPCLLFSLLLQHHKQPVTQNQQVRCKSGEKSTKIADSHAANMSNFRYPSHSSPSNKPKLGPPFTR